MDREVYTFVISLQCQRRAQSVRQRFWPPLRTVSQPTFVPAHEEGITTTLGILKHRDRHAGVAPVPLQQCEDGLPGAWMGPGMRRQRDRPAYPHGARQCAVHEGIDRITPDISHEDVKVSGEGPVDVAERWLPGAEGAVELNVRLCQKQAARSSSQRHYRRP